MICPKCKSEIKDPKATVCEYCGEELDPEVETEVESKPQAKQGFFAMEERENPLPWWKYLVAIGVYFGIMEIGAFIFQIILTFIYSSITGQPARVDDAYTLEASQFINIWMQILTYAAVTTATVILLWKPLKEDFRYSGTKVGKYFAFVGMGIAGVYATNILCTVIYMFLEIFLGSGFLTGDSANQAAIVDMLKGASTFSFILYAIVLVICAPLVEELIFRKALCTLLAKFKRIWRIVFSAVIFGAIHIVVAMLGYLFSGNMTLLLKEFLLGLPYVAMGAVLAAAYEYSNKNVFVSFLIHAINNLVSVVTIFVLLQQMK